MVMGVKAMETQSAYSGNSFFAITDQAGQQEVAIKGICSGTSFIKSSASWTAQRSALMATSNTSAKPSCFMAARSFPGVTLRAELSHKGRSHSGVYPLSCLDGADHLEDLGLVRNGSKGTVHQAHAAGNAFVIVDICFSVLV